MERVLFAACAVAIVLCGCGSAGATSAPIASATPGVTLPGSAAIRYATSTQQRGGPREVDVHGTDPSAVLYAFQEGGGAEIRFDPSGMLWSDAIGEFFEFRPDGTAAGTIFGAGALLAFDEHGTLYTASARSVDVYAVSAAAKVTLQRSIATDAYPRFAAADAAGNLYVATATAGASPFTPLYGPVRRYAPGADGVATPVAVEERATGPVAVDANGNVYAAYGGTVGVWTASGFGTGALPRTLPLGATGTIVDIAVDRSGGAYVIVRPAGATFTTISTLFYVSSGAAAATPLQAGFINAVTTP